MNTLSRLGMHLKGSENLVIVFQGECTNNEEVPRQLEIESSKYMLAGVVHGNKVHTTATVTKQNGFLYCDDVSVTAVSGCVARRALMMIYTKGGVAKEANQLMVHQPV